MALAGEKSDYQQAIQNYIEYGYTESEAKKKAYLDLGKQVVSDVAAGALMGGVLGAGTAISSNIAKKNVLSGEYAKAYGQAALISDNAQAIIDNAKEFGIDTQNAEKALAELDIIEEEFDKNPTSKELHDQWQEQFEKTADTLSELELYIEQSGGQTELNIAEQEFQSENYNSPLESRETGINEFDEEVERQADIAEASDIIENDLHDRGVTNQDRIVNNFKAKTIANEVSKLHDGKIKVDGDIRTDKISRKVQAFYDSKGLETVWFKNSYVKDKNGNFTKAQINGFTNGNKIYLNSDVPIERQIFKHEYHHTLENAKGFENYSKRLENSKAFKDWILNKAKKLNATGTYNNQYRAVLNNYISMYGVATKLSNTQAKNEAFADFMAEELFSGKNFNDTMNKLEEAFEDKNGFQKFIDTIKDIVSKIKEALGGSASIEALERNIIKLQKQIDSGKTVQNKNTDNGVKFDNNKKTFSVDNSNESDYNENTKEFSYERTDEFKRLQEESRRLYDKDIESFHNGSKQCDEGIRGRLSRVFEKQIKSASGSNRNVSTSIVNKKTGKNISIYENVDYNLFHDVFEIAQKYLFSGDAVDVHEAAEYKNCKNYLTSNGLGGFSITADGDLISVYNLGEKGFLKSISNFVKENGAKTLDCFNSTKQCLPDIYSYTLGFKNAAILDFNYEILVETKGKEYADYFVKNYGEAPVCFMVNTESEVETKHFTKDQYDEAVEYRNSYLEADSKETAFSIGEEADTEYMSAVKNGDTETAQRLVDEAAEKQFANSKIRDKNGKLRKVYHGTNEKFSEFNNEKISKRNVWGKAFYSSTSKSVAGDYGSNVLTGYLNIENPYINYKSDLGTAKEIKDKYFSDMWVSTYYLGIDYIQNKLDNSPLDLLQFIAEHNNKEVKDILADFGYDGVIDDSEIVFFNSKQFKSADAVTYDDNGNVIPLSERFNEDENDIRYMLDEENFDENGDYFDIDEDGEVSYIKNEEYQKRLKKNPKLAVLDKQQIELKAKAILKNYQSRMDSADVASQLLAIYNDIKNIDENGNENYTIFWAEKNQTKMPFFTIHRLNKLYTKNTLEKKNPMMIYIG